MTHFAFRNTLSMAFVLAVSAATASTRRDDVPDQAYVDLSNLGAYASVGQIQTNSALGSGTLISSSWMLTAAHVLSNANTTKNFSLAGTTYAIDNVVRFTDSYTLGVNDFALCHLSTAVTGIAPALLWGGAGQVGGIGTSVGYGGIGTGLTGNTGPLGRRAFQNVVDSYNANGLSGLASDFDNPAGTTNSLGSANALGLEGCVTPGDSGGSLWEAFGGQNYVVGVTSYVWWNGGAHPPYGLYGDGSGYSQVADVSAWIFANSGVRTVNAIPTPEPSTLVAAALGAVMFVRRRRPRV